MLLSRLFVDIQLSAAIICACLPTYGQLLPKGRYLAAKRSLATWYSRKQGSAGSELKTENSIDDDHHLSNGQTGQMRHQNFVKTDDMAFLTDIEADPEHSDRSDHPIDRIVVRNDVVIVWWGVAEWNWSAAESLLKLLDLLCVGGRGKNQAPRHPGHPPRSITNTQSNRERRAAWSL